MPLSVLLFSVWGYIAGLQGKTTFILILESYVHINNETHWKEQNHKEVPYQNCCTFMEEK